MAIITASSASQTMSAYNDNIAGRVVEVLTYDSPTILFRLDPMPVAPAPGANGCRPATDGRYFIIRPELPADVRAQLLSRLMTAKATNEVVNIGFDRNECIHGWIQAHRVG